MTRKYRSPRTNKYNWYSIENVNFKQIAKEITEVYENIWKLYQYIYDSNELDRLNESLNHGYTSLRRHLLIITNLLVQEFQKKKEPTLYHNKNRLLLADR